MPKRLFPFDYDFLPQCKTHVSEKEVNMGVLMDRRMKSIYDKTRALLYQRSKDLTDPLHFNSKKLVDSNFECKVTHYKQTFLDNNCHIQSTGLIKTKSLNFCAQCKTVVLDDKCSFCDKSFCRSCLAKCMKCDDEFCKKCSMNIFMEHDDGTICLGCFH